jgi:DNA-binding transcriptional LysR family regulator
MFGTRTGPYERNQRSEDFFFESAGSLKVEFDLNLLAVALAIEERRSVSGAAKQLKTSQPSVSRALSQLRETFQDELFIKTCKGMLPTPRALALVSAARDVFERINLEVQAPPSFDPLHMDTHFTLALSEAGELFSLPRIVATLRQINPCVRVISICPSQKELIDGLQQGDIDLAVGTFPELNTDIFYRQKISAIPFSCLMRADHPVQEDPISFEQYDKLKHVMVTRPGVTSGTGEAFQRKRVGQNIQIVLSHIVGLPSVVQRTDAVATVVRPLAVHLAATNRNLKVVGSPFKETEAISQCWHRRFNNDPRSRWLREMVRTELRNDFGAVFSQ